MSLRDSYPEGAELVLLVQCTRCYRNKFFDPLVAIGENVTHGPDCDECSGTMMLVMTIRMDTTIVAGDVYFRPTFGLDRNTSRSLQSVLDLFHNNDPRNQSAEEQA